MPRLSSLQWCSVILELLVLGTGSIFRTGNLSQAVLTPLSGLESLCNYAVPKCGLDLHQQEAEQDAQWHLRQQSFGQLSWVQNVSLSQNQWKWETTHWFWGKKGNYLSLLFLEGKVLLRSIERIILQRKVEELVDSNSTFLTAFSKEA